MAETKKYAVCLEEEVWAVFHVYYRLISMKMQRRGYEPPTQGTVLGGILTYFLQRHGRDIVDAYTEAKNRKRIRTIKDGVQQAAIDFEFDPEAPQYPVPEPVSGDGNEAKTANRPVRKLTRRRRRNATRRPRRSSGKVRLGRPRKTSTSASKSGDGNKKAG